MNVFTRTRKLVSANLHDWFDRLERPEKLAKQSLRDLEGAIDAATTATARSLAAERLLERRRDECRRKLEDWERRAAESLRAGEEPLARKALEQQFELSQAVAEIERQLAEAAAVNATLRSQLDLMRSRYRRTQDRVTMQAARRAAATAAREVAESTCVSLSPTAPLADLERAYDRTERSILETEARTELCRDVKQDADDDAERRFADCQREQYVADALQRLRSASAATG